MAAAADTSPARPPRSLRQRLLLGLMAPILVLVTLWAWATYSIALHFADLAYDRALEDTVLTVAAQVRIEDGLPAVDLPPAARQMVEFDQVDRVYYCVVDQDERLLAGNRHLPGRPIPPHADVVFRDDTVDGGPVRLAEAVAAGGDDNPGPRVVVRVAETVNKRRILAREVLSYTLVPQGLLIAAIAALLWWGVGRGIAPLRRVSDEIARRFEDDLTPLDEGRLPAELQQQVRVINMLMGRLRATVDRQRRFIADATHQLRTPIAVLRTQVELAKRPQEAEAWRAGLDHLGASVERLQRLANQLLSLSRAEAMAEQRLDVRPFAFAELVEEAVAERVPLALQRGVDVRLVRGGGLPTVRGDRTLCREMIANLVDNAIRYAPAGGHVVVSLAAADGTARLSVRDDGPGIPAEERGRVFERFYRRAGGGDDASGGSGLGLAIAHEIALRHGGRIELADARPAPGLVVTVVIPAVTAPREGAAR